MSKPTALTRIWQLRPVSGLLVALLLCQILLLFPAGQAQAAIMDDVQSQAFVLMDGNTGQILLQRDMHGIRKPASTTKIMTALLALEKGDTSDPVTVSKTAVSTVPRDASSVGLMPGEIIPLEKLLYAVMLESANEGANAVAEYVSGTIEDFAALMNQRAKELGAKNTHFSNANGLNSDDHYTTAYDMALIMKKAIEDQRFLTICSAYQHFLDPTNLQKERRIFNNKNRLLPQGAMPYEGILGGKTGYTTASQNTLVEAACRDGRTLICVVFQAPSSLASFQDTVTLLNYGFDNFRSVTYADSEYEDSYTYLLHNDISSDQVNVLYGEPVENEDGSTSVGVSFNLPTANADLMYPEISDATLTSPIPPPPPEKAALFSTAGVSSLLSETPPLSWIVGLFSFLALVVGKLLGLVNLLPAGLAFIIKLLLSVFAALLVLACFFRTRRWLRRRKRLLQKQKMEAKRRAYREQQSYWG